MREKILIAGAGISGLAAAIALQRTGWQAVVHEAAKEFGEVGAGIQLGPNATRRLRELGVLEALLPLAVQPESIAIADARTGRPLHRILLGAAVENKYGAPYLSVHRADLHRVLLRAAQELGVELHNSSMLSNLEHSVQYLPGQESVFIHQTPFAALLGADGLHSQVREHLLSDGAARSTGHAAYRSLISASQLPENLRSNSVRVWWARDVHVLCYPLKAGSLYNLVVLTEAEKDSTAANQSWSIPAQHRDVMRSFGQVEPQLQRWLDAGGASGWQRWNLFDRPPLKEQQMAQGCVALLGDAAHPMLPYMAQGAAMGLEDALCLAQHLRPGCNVPAALQTYAKERAARNARVVRTAVRNGKIFHLSGLAAQARNAFLALQGTRVLGLEWLYAG